MTMTPHDFHCMTSLRCDGALINLEGVLGTQLGIDLLGRRYTVKTIHYFNIKADYRPFLEVIVDNWAKMARAFLLYLLGAYLFTKGGKMVSLRWLALFRTLWRLKKPTTGKCALPTCTLPWTCSAGGLCASLWGLGISLRLVFFSLLL